jgi:Phage tail lysozyme
MAGYSVTYSVVDQATAQIDAINRRIVQMRAPLERQAKSLQKFVDVSGLKNVATGFNEISKQAFGAFTEMSKSVPVLGTITSAATLTGMVRLAQSFAEMNRTLVQNADRIGLSSQKLQEMQDMARLAGGSAEDMTSTLQALTTISRNAALGIDQNARAAFNRLGIALRDANGQFRSSADLLPEVLTKIGQLKDPADRARVAAATLGDAQAKVFETFLHGTKTWDQYQKDAAGYMQVTAEQTAAAQKWNEALGALGVGFDHLTQQIGATMAKALTPLVQWAGEWVKVHTPAIVQGIDTLVGKYPDLTAAGVAVLTFFTGRWAAGMLASIARVALGFGAVGTGVAGAGGSGLLGQLGILSAILGTAVIMMKGIEAATPAVEDFLWGKGTSGAVAKLGADANRDLKKWAPWMPDWMVNVLAPTPAGAPDTGTPPGTGATPAPGAGLATGPRVSAAPTPSPVPAPMRTPGYMYQLPGAPPTAEVQNQRAREAYDYFKQRGWSDAASAGLVARMQRESNFNPQGTGDAGAAYGAMQWHPDRQENFRKVMGKDIRGSSFEEQLAFQDWELRNTEKRSGDLLKNPNLTPAQAGDIVSRKYIRPGDVEGEAAKTGALSEQYASKYTAAPPVAPIAPVIVPPIAAPIAPATPAAPVAPEAPSAPTQTADLMPVPAPAPSPIGGSVAVTITHQNPPPNTTVTAVGTGAVDVAPPRTERQQLAAA